MRAGALAANLFPPYRPLDQRRNFEAGTSFCGQLALLAETTMSQNPETLAATLRGLAKRTLFWLASPKLAVVLLATLAAVLAWATLLEAKHGSAYSRWYVYESSWFFGLLALLGIHSFCAAASRFPWQRQHTGFVVTHAGLLVLLAGAVWSFWEGVEGRVSLGEGETTQHMVLAHRGQVTAFWVGRPQEAPFEFTFDGGPVNWPAGKILDMGAVDGVKARILAYYPHAIPDESWVADASNLGGPAVQFKASDQTKTPIAEGWLADQQFGDAVAVGPIRLQLQRAATDRMLEDFLQPPVDDLGEKGRLVIYFGDAVERVSLDTRLGQKIPLGSTGVTVEILEYLPNAVPDKLGNFTSKGAQPKNPMVELRVYLPDQEQPLRQIAFAKDPLLNLDGVYPRVCPVKFRFYHAAVQQETAVELLQTSDGTLFGRLCTAGHYTSQGELHPGDRLDLPGNFRLDIVAHIPHSKRQVTFTTSGSVTGKKARDKSEPAALVEISVGDKAEQVWLRRNDPAYGQSTLALPGGTLALSYEDGRVPLGFSLGLIECRRELNPGRVGNAAFSSKVRVVDPQRGLDQERLISMNQPLTHGNITFYQSSSGEAGHGRKTSTFHVASDPGRPLKYGGSLMICLGIAVMFSTRAYSFQKHAGSSLPSSQPSGNGAIDEERSPVPLRPAA
jgi:hypothetical protein